MHLITSSTLYFINFVFLFFFLRFRLFSERYFFLNSALVFTRNMSLCCGNYVDDITARVSLVGWGAMLQAARSRVRDLMSWMNFSSVSIILSAVLSPGFYSASNRNYYQSQKRSSWEKDVANCKADNRRQTTLYTFWGSSTYHNPTGLSALLSG
jgi:hypothetical protein